MTNALKPFLLAALGLALVAVGLYGVTADDKPGAPVFATLLMAAGLALGLRSVRDRLPTWVARTVLIVGVAAAAGTAFLIHATVVTGALFADTVPSVVDVAPASSLAATVERARAIVRAAMHEQNLPGVSVAVAADGAIAWSEGFGWRDVATKAPVTPTTWFHIGTAASTMLPAVGSQARPHTRTDTAADWSPEHVGEPEEDFPGFTALRHLVWQPLGLMPRDTPLAAERATFYVPREGDDPTRGRRPMAMRDLACCADGTAVSSTPSELVQLALATRAADVDGLLAGGTVMSLVSADNGRVIVAVTSNIAHAKTHALAQRVADAFAHSTTERP